MASAIDVIQGIIKLGTAVKSAASASGSKDWSTVLGSILGDSAVSKTVTDLYKQLKGSTPIDTALSAIRDKEAAVLKGAGVADASSLHGQDLLDYHSLADAELALATQKLVSALDASFLDWLVDDALPSLTTVLPLLMAL